MFLLSAKKCGLPRDVVGKPRSIEIPDRLVPGVSIDFHDSDGAVLSPLLPPAERQLEQDLLELLNFEAPWIEGLLRQENSFSYVHTDGREYEHVIHCLLVWKLRSAKRGQPAQPVRPNIWGDIASRESIAGDWRNWRRRIRAGQAFAASIGNCVYQLWHEGNIRTPVLDNSRLLRPYRLVDTDPSYDLGVRDGLLHFGKSTPAQLIAALSKDVATQALLRQSLWKALAQRWVLFDATRPLADDTPIWLLKGKLPKPSNW